MAVKTLRIRITAAEALLLFFGTAIIVQQRADATTSAGCFTDENIKCGADKECSECISMELDNQDELIQCATNYQAEGYPCEAFPCCQDEFSPNDCVGNEAFVNIWLCSFEGGGTTTEGGVCPDELVCPGGSGGDVVDGTDDADGVGGENGADDDMSGTNDAGGANSSEDSEGGDGGNGAEDDTSGADDDAVGVGSDDADEADGENETGDDMMSGADDDDDAEGGGPSITSSASDDECSADFQTCSGDTECAECLTLADTNEVQECTANNLFDGTDVCTHLSIAPCCIDAVSSNGCMGNNAFTEYYQCRNSQISTAAGQGTCSALTCDDDSVGGVDGGADGADTAGETSGVQSSSPGTALTFGFGLACLAFFTSVPISP